METKKHLFLSQDEIFKIRSIARSFDKFKVLTASSGKKYYSFSEVVLSESEFDLLKEFETLNPLNFD